MNILFSLYGDIQCNSGLHVAALAEELNAAGCDCVVAATAAAPPFGAGVSVLSHSQALSGALLYRNGRPPDLVHVWNPREINRKFRHQLALKSSFRTVIHLEDNEEFIARCFLGEEGYRLACRDLYPGTYPDTLSHPRHAEAFKAQATGFTLLVDSLIDHVPPRAPRITFWPAADRRFFQLRPRNDQLRQTLGIGSDTIVLAYHGNSHAANFHEVRSLYLAVALLNQQGVQSVLLRAGVNSVPASDEYANWARSFTVDFGFVSDRQRMADILAAADLFVQPGKSDAFNHYRFPSKTPEFFAMGRPVVLPRTNIGLTTRHEIDAYVLADANGPAIAQAVKRIMSDRALYERLAAGARAFSARRLNWAASASAVRHFYERIVAGHRREIAA